jgi:hypothetical protein
LNQRDGPLLRVEKALETLPSIAMMAFARTDHIALGGAFRENAIIKRELRRSKDRIEHRLRERVWSPQDKPMLSARNI